MYEKICPKENLKFNRIKYKKNSRCKSSCSKEKSVQILSSLVEYCQAVLKEFLFNTCWH